MRHKIFSIVMALGLAATVAGSVAAEHVENHQARLEDRYLAGSLHAHAAGMHHAVGPTDCSGVTAGALGPNAGGVCFNLTDFPEGADLFLRAQDDHSTTDVSLFAGFDLDGDGCVGCEPGADAAWTGTNALGADLVNTSEPLVVFVRAASLEDGSVLVATTGNLTLDVLDDGTSACGHEGQDRRGECGEPFKSDLPYPYPCVPECTG